MNNEEIIKEEQYQKNKKKVIRLAIFILVIGLALGGFLFYRGISVKNQLKAKKDQETVEKEKQQEQKQKESEKKQEQNNARIAELEKLISNTQKKIDNANVELTKLQNEETTIFTEDRGFSKRYNDKEIEITKKRNEINNLQKELSGYKTELSNLKFSLQNSKINESFSSAFTNFESRDLDVPKYLPYFIIGGFVIVFFGIISLSIYLVAKRREIAMFTIQQSKPITDELSKASGNLAREIAKGIKEGKENAQVPHVVRCNHCGAENEIIGKTGKCEYCKSKISYEEK